MSNYYLQLRRITFSNSKKVAEMTFSNGVNVICGASDTGKSFLVESIDYMIGGAELRDIPERVPYNEIQIDFNTTAGEKWRLRRATSGGSFKAENLVVKDSGFVTLKQKHEHDKVENVSGFLLDKIGLLGKRILRSKMKGTTQSLSFRNLARLVIIQEGEIQQTGSPFWGGQHTQKTSDLATIKLLLTGVDESSILETPYVEISNKELIELIDEFITEIKHELVSIDESEEDLKYQLGDLENAIKHHREILNTVQAELNSFLTRRRKLLDNRSSIQDRLYEVIDLLARFDLLMKHYTVDIERLTAIEESGTMFAYVKSAQCPLCGSSLETQQHNTACDGNVAAIIQAASAEILKIERLKTELQETVAALRSEVSFKEQELSELNEEYAIIDKQVQEKVAPKVSEERTSYSRLVDKRAEVQKWLYLYERVTKLEERKISVVQNEEKSSTVIASGLPDSVAHEFSLRVSNLLKAWDFPGDNRVHFDKETSDFVIDGKPRSSRGKGLRAITHAAVTIALFEYCLENDLPHPGFIVLDSPLLAYFKPEGDEDKLLQGTKLKERFYSYLVNHHSSNSQIIIVENEHPPDSVKKKLKMTVFTGNPNEGRQGFLQ